MFGRPGRARPVHLLPAFALSVALALTATSPATAVTPTGQPAEAKPTTAKFPPGFLWGVATSGFQSEGSFPDSNWTRYAENEAPGSRTPTGTPSTSGTATPST